MDWTGLDWTGLKVLSDTGGGGLRPLYALLAHNGPPRPNK